MDNSCSLSLDNKTHLTMSCQLVTAGRHHLRTDSIEDFARQLSEIFDINVDYGVYEDEPVIMGSIIRHAGGPRYWLKDEHDDEWPVNFSLEEPEGSKEYLDGDIYLLRIYRDIVQISMTGWPYRGSDYMSFFYDDPYPGQAADMASFRRRLKEVFARFGADKVYCFDGGYSSTGFLEDKLFLPWDEFENYILSGKYLDETENQDVYHWKEDSMLLNVSEFISGVNPTRTKGSADVYIDDFKDIQ